MNPPHPMKSIWFGFVFACCVCGAELSHLSLLSIAMFGIERGVHLTT
jgi:hypothetical protein